jgi:cyclopropane-fatty-acyl-phospholipid synthase
MKSKIYQGEIMHRRLEPVNHHFTYPVQFYGFDLAELDELAKTVKGFGYNRFRPVALHDVDYLERDERPLEDKIRTWLQRQGCEAPVSRIELITSARFFNYVFNPVSFYVCFDGEDRVCCLAAEVNNTSGEKHLYLANEMHEAGAGWKASRSIPKDFYVSPFHDLEGQYAFQVSKQNGSLEIRVDLWKNGRPVFLSKICGTARPLTTGDLCKTLIRFPITSMLTMPRILWQSAKLRFGKGLNVYPKPEPGSQMTIRGAPPTLLERFAARLVLGSLRRIHSGCLRLNLPDGRKEVFGNPGDREVASLTIRRSKLFTRLLFEGANGFGEGFVHGDWESDDVTGVLEVLANNGDCLYHDNLWVSFLARARDRLGHLRRKNTLQMSRRNIQDHYDLGNEFFRTFLDPGMTYSCALYRRDDETLEEAQRNKIHAVLDRAGIRPEHHVLEIGSGWGSFAVEAARRTGCRVTTITLSEEQQEYANERVRTANLEDQVKVLLCDYRDVRGSFDRIVSIEMLEAVGHEYFGTFLGMCDRLLKPGGRVVLQVITIPDDRYEEYRQGCDWIQKRIFPGGLLPSLAALREAMARASSLAIRSVENIGPHYARTLRDWRTAFLKNTEELRRLGFDEEFLKVWVYYLCYSEAGFSTLALNDLHLVLERE